MLGAGSLPCHPTQTEAIREARSSFNQVVMDALVRPFRQVNRRHDRNLRITRNTAGEGQARGQAIGFDRSAAARRCRCCTSLRYSNGSRLASRVPVAGHTPPAAALASADRSDLAGDKPSLQTGSPGTQAAGSGCG